MTPRIDAIGCCDGIVTGKRFAVEGLAFQVEGLHVGLDEAQVGVQLLGAVL